MKTVHLDVTALDTQRRIFLEGSEAPLLRTPGKKLH